MITKKKNNLIRTLTEYVALRRFCIDTLQISLSIFFAVFRVCNTSVCLISLSSAVQLKKSQKHFWEDSWDARSQTLCLSLKRPRGEEKRKVRELAASQVIFSSSESGTNNSANYLQDSKELSNANQYFHSNSG